MATTRPKAVIAVAYEEAAREYLRGLPMEHFMEAIPQATQRKITLESLDLLSIRRPEVYVFNELLVQYPLAGQRKPGQVVPDNMVVISDQAIEAETSYNLPLEPARPFWVLEYISKNNKRKDYEESFDKYERDLKVPYYLVFYPDQQELTLYRHTGKKYVSVKPNKHGRYAIPELDLEVGLEGGWVRYWYEGAVLPLPGDLQRDLDAAERRADEESRRAERRLKARRNSSSNCKPSKTHEMPPKPNWPNCALRWSGKKHAHASDKNPTSDTADCRLYTRSVLLSRATLFSCHA
jgi:Uma2 family endonuclease